MMPGRLGISAMVLAIAVTATAYASATGSMPGMPDTAMAVGHQIVVTDEDSKLARGMTVQLLKGLGLNEDVAHKLSEAVDRLDAKAMPIEESIAALRDQLAKLRADGQASKATVDQTEKQLTVRQAQLKAVRNTARLEIPGAVGQKASVVLGVLLFDDTPVVADAGLEPFVKSARDILATKAAMGHGSRMVLSHSLMDMMGGGSGMNHSMGGMKH